MTSLEKTSPALVLEQAGSRDALRELVSVAVQEALDREFEACVGAAPYERTATRRGWRNGSYERTLTTRVGQLTVRVLRDRDGIFQPTLFARYERAEQALVLAMVEWVAWFNTQRLLEAIGYLPPAEYEEHFHRTQGTHVAAGALT